jgi:hypothetical protein
LQGIQTIPQQRRGRFGNGAGSLLRAERRAKVECARRELAHRRGEKLRASKASIP